MYDERSVKPIAGLMFMMFRTYVACYTASHAMHNCPSCYQLLLAVHVWDVLCGNIIPGLADLAC